MIETITKDEIMASGKLRFGFFTSPAMAATLVTPAYEIYTNAIVEIRPVVPFNKKSFTAAVCSYFAVPNTKIDINPNKLIDIVIDNPSEYNGEIICHSISYIKRNCLTFRFFLHILRI